MHLFCLCLVTQGLPIDVIKDLFFSHYYMWYVEGSPADTGNSGVSRPRVFVMMCHRETGRVLADPVVLYQRIAQKIAIYVSTSPMHYLIASDREVQLEAMALAASRQIVYRPVAWAAFLTVPVLFLLTLHFRAFVFQDHRDLEYLLTRRERDALGVCCYQYFSKYGKRAQEDEDLMVFLGDDPNYSLTWTATSKKVPCFRNNSGLFWVPSRGRWLTVKEKLGCLGMPVDPECSTAMSVPMLACKDTHRSGTLVGNSMHLSNIALVELVVLVCFGRKEDHV